MRRFEETGLAQFAIIGAGLSIVLFFEWHTDEPLVVLPVLLFVSFIGGWMAPRRFGLIGMTLGCAIFVAHALSTAAGVGIPRYQHQEPSMGDWITMSLLVLPALAAAFGGSKMSAVMARCA